MITPIYTVKKWLFGLHDLKVEFNRLRRERNRLMWVIKNTPANFRECRKDELRKLSRKLYRLEKFLRKNT